MKRVIILLLTMGLMSKMAYSQDIGAYLILTDIGKYQKITKGGPSGNILAATGHFSLDHIDKSFEVAYINDADELWIDVQVTVHAGAESDQWLLHEAEDAYRGSTYGGKLGRLSESASLRNTEGNNWIFDWGNVNYRWISNNVVVDIHYVDLQGTKPEPLEIVKAYLAKFPSTIDANKVLESGHDVLWIKNEMARRMWLCGKWDMAFQTGKTAEKEMLSEIVEHLNVFLDYRDKYYGVPAKAEKRRLSDYKYQNNGTGIRETYKGLKTWWEANKAEPIAW